MTPLEADAVKQLRARTGAPIADCLEAWRHMQGTKVEGTAGADQGGLWSEHDNPCNVDSVSRLIEGPRLAPSADAVDEDDATPAPGLVALVLLVSGLVVCGVVRATIYGLTGY